MEVDTSASGSAAEPIQMDPLFQVRVAQHLWLGSPLTLTLAPLQQGLQSILAPLYARNASPEEIADVTARATQFYAQSCATRLRCRS